MGRELGDGFQWKVYQITSVRHSPEHKGFYQQKLEIGIAFTVLNIFFLIIIYTEIKGPGFIFQHK